MTTSDTTEQDANAENHQATEQGLAAIDKVAKPNDELPVRIKAVSDDHEKKWNWTIDHPDTAVGHARLLEALATKDVDFAHGIMGQLFNIGSQIGEINEREANFMLGIIKGVAPRDPVETMLAAQMACVHVATMKFGDSLSSYSREQQERVFNRLARTFVAQVEALKRYRGGREQNVTVRNISVRDGSHAYVGIVNQTAGNPTADLPATASPPTAPSDTTPMQIIEDREDAKAPVAAAAEPGQTP